MTAESMKNQALEHYLSTLESTLRPFSVSDRTDILMEIKSHVLDAIERDPQASVESVLSALGEPEIVANRYLLERNLKPAKPPINPIVRWLVIGFLGTLALLVCLCAFIISRINPLVHVDDKNNRVTLLGGLIEVDGKADQVWVRGFGSGKNSSFSGTQTVEDHGRVAFTFQAGKVDVRTAEGRDFSWTCTSKFEKAPEASIVTEKEISTVKLDLSNLPGVKCELAVPSGVPFELKGDAGKIDFDKPRFDVTAKLAKGRVGVSPIEGDNYVYDLKVAMGKADGFVSSAAADAHKINIDVGAGRIAHED